MKKETTICKSPNGTKFNKGQKVCSHGDESTYGWIDCWDEENDCWKLTTGTEGAYKWWPEGEPELIS